MRHVRLLPTVFLLGCLASSPVLAAWSEADRYWQVGHGAFEDGLWDVARRQLERLSREYPQDPRRPRALYILGKILLAANELEPAVNALRQARIQDPAVDREHAAGFWEGEALFRLRRFDEARQAYLVVARASPPGEFAAESLYGAAWSEMETGRQDEAVALFRELLQRYPTHPLAGSATLDLARELMTRKQWEEAATILRPHPARFPGHPKASDIRYLLALAELRRGAREAGVTAFERFLALDPKHPQAPGARLLVARELSAMGKGKEALDHYQALVRDFPEDPLVPQALLEGGVLARRLSRPKEASAALERLVRLMPNDPLAHQAALELATQALREARYSRAIHWAEKARESDDPNLVEEAQLIDGEAQLRLGRPKAALEAFQAVYERNEEKTPRYFQALARGGLAYEALGAREQAASHYELVIAGAKDPDLVRWARDRLKAVRSAPRGKRS